MGFFGGIMKVLQGKPVFDETSKPAKRDAFRDARGSKIYPELVVERSDCHLNGDRMQLYVYIKNVSTLPLTLDRLRFLSTDRQQRSDLSVGELSQYLLYDGPRLQQDHQADFEITYFTTATRDYFSALYYAEFKPEADGTFSVPQFRRQRAVKDIYE